MPGAAARRQKADAKCAGLALSHLSPLALVAAVVGLSLAVVVLTLPAPASAESCPNAAFRNGPSALLPDCRAYEQVTPVAKDGGYILRAGAVGGTGGIAPSGETVQLESFAALAGGQSDIGLPGSIGVAERTESGWRTQPTVPVASQFLVSEPGTRFGYRLTDLDNRTELWELRGLSQPENSIGLYLVKAGGEAVEVGPALPPSAPVGEVGPNGDGAGINVVGVSATATRMVFELKSNAVAQWPFAGAETLLEYLGTGNREPLLVGLDNEGKFADECPTQELGSILAEHEQNAISADGETVFFTDKCRGGIFARVGNGLAGAHTISISEPTKADCATCDTEEAVRQPAAFLGASEDGSRVYFETAQPLLGGETGMNVYEYDANAREGERVAKVTGGDGTVANPEPGFQGVVQISPDGSHIYFVATGLLTTTKSYAGKEAQLGGDNLYLFERDAQYPDGRTVFIATLPFQDRILWGVYKGETGYVCGSVSTLPNEESDTTPDGRFLVFLSHVLLTPGDVSSAGQVFEYDAQQNSMVRVSVGENGYNKNGNVSLAPSARFDSTFCDPEDPRIGYASYQQAVYESAAYTRSLTISADGSYVFFESPDALTPQALNFAQIGAGNRGEPVYAENVYEYHEGNVYLISDGQDISLAKSESTSRFEGTDLSGRDVFLATSDQLVPQDTDSNVDIYDARVDGGFPSPPSPEECTADACQGELGSAPVLLSPGSEFQQGGENVSSAETPTVNAEAKKSKETKKKKKKRRGRRRVGRPRRGKGARKSGAQKRGGGR
jgi:hypothetical protein